MSINPNLLFLRESSDMRLRAIFVVAMLVPSWSTGAGAAEAFLVERGEPRAEIIIAEKPERTVRLAAHELQTYVEKLSGAKLSIATEPTKGVPVQIYIGRSTHTDRLQVTAEGLKAGAFRIKSGDNWLVLLGDDTEFTPIEPWAKSNSEIVTGKTQAEWDKITGALWRVPGILMYKHQLDLPGTIGLPTTAATIAPSLGAKVPPLRMWDCDERGSFNAVNGFLQRLGVRWYMPGELGEIVPTLKTIPLAKIDEIVRPDFELRRFSYRFSIVGNENALWGMRLGMRNPPDIQDAHGMDSLTHRSEVFAAHPEWYALYGGKRRFDLNENNQLCYSNEELLQETVRFVRAQFDHYKLDTVSVMPPDGYTAMCQCELCRGKDTPERDNRGLLSDYVWDFVNRVAREVRKTHPHGKVLNCAYGVYSLPPLKIEKLEPNVVVSIVGGRVPRLNKPAQQEEFRKLREAWLEKTSNPLINFENYPFIDRGWYLPAYTPHVMGESINALKGRFLGEDISLSAFHDFATNGIGFNHFQTYFNARMYWGGKQQDVDAMFQEYCRLFYGPAEAEMRAFFLYAEENWQEMEREKAKVDRVLELFAVAKAKVHPSTVYGRRIALIDDFLKALRSKSDQLGKIRGPLPVLRLVGEAKGSIRIDGRLDDEAWTNCPVASTGRMSELQTGRIPTFGTTVKSAWIGNDLYFAIRCNEHPGEKLNVGSTRKDDSAMWYGDAVEVLLETDSRSYYQIAVNPSGAIVDLDRTTTPSAWFGWDSQAEVKTHVADDHWIVEMRIPVTQDENDPLHQVIGRKPSQSLPWHINFCRQRIREDGTEYSALSPTSAENFHNLMKFAKFYDGNSYQFAVGEPEADFLRAIRTADDFARKGKYAEALSVCKTAAERDISDLQKSAALEKAAAYARNLRGDEEAAALTARIPIVAVKKVASMQSLLDRAKASEVVAQFGKEDIATWPFWKRGDGYFARGRAYSATKAGKEAEADLSSALAWSSDPQTRDAIHLALAQNRESHLLDDDRALEAFQAIVADRKQLGGANEFYALQGIARILTKRGRFDEAIAALRRADLDKLRGVWRGMLLLSVGDVQMAAGRKAEGRASYQSVADDADIEPRLRKQAQDKLSTP